MPLPTSSLGRSVSSTAYVDTRWLLSYAVGVDDHSAVLTDTTRAPAKVRKTTDFHRAGLQGGGIVAHPVFVWAVEWGLLVDERMQELGLSSQLLPRERGSAVHYAQDIIVHRPIRSGETLHFACRVVAMEKRKRGTVVVYRFDHRDEAGQAVSTTWNTSYWRETGLDGGSCHIAGELPPPLPSFVSGRDVDDAGSVEEIPIPISAFEGVKYTEMSRIWNPIHSDPAAAKASALPEPILHGTATMARAVSVIVNRYGGSDARRVTRVAVQRFGAVVRMPSTLTLRVLSVRHEKEGDDARRRRRGSGGRVAVRYEVLNEEGKRVLQGGIVVLSRRRAASMASL